MEKIRFNDAQIPDLTNPAEFKVYNGDKTKGTKVKVKKMVVADPGFGVELVFEELPELPYFQVNSFELAIQLAEIGTQFEIYINEAGEGIEAGKSYIFLMPFLDQNFPLGRPYAMNFVNISEGWTGPDHFSGAQVSDRWHKITPYYNPNREERIDYYGDDSLNIDNILCHEEGAFTRLTYQGASAGAHEFFPAQSLQSAEIPGESCGFRVYAMENGVDSFVYSFVPGPHSSALSTLALKAVHPIETTIASYHEGSSNQDVEIGLAEGIQ